MKIDGGAVTVFQLMLSFLLVAITASTVVAGQKEAVLDTRGNPVKANTPYYINGTYFRVITDRSLLRPSSCPQRVVMSNILPRAEPVIFELSSDVVCVSTELNIKFARLNHCPGSRYWRVEDSSKAVVLNGPKSSNDSTFTIKKEPIGAYYTIAFGNADKPTAIDTVRINFIVRESRLVAYDNFGFDVSFTPAQV